MSRAEEEKRTKHGVRCPCCNEVSGCTYRCEHCGRDLVEETGTEAIQ